MKTIERIVLKLVAIHFLLLLLSQIVIHSFGMFHQLNKMVYYEGVNKQSYQEIVEIFNQLK